MSVRITIECDDYYVAESLFTLGSHTEESDILEPVYNKKKTATYTDDHCTAHIEYVNKGWGKNYTVEDVVGVEWGKTYLFVHFNKEDFTKDAYPVRFNLNFY